MGFKDKKKSILFYNAIPMPHSIRLQNLLCDSGYLINFWYYKDLTTLYPWKTLDSSRKYIVFGSESNNIWKLLKQAKNSDLVIITGWHNKIHILLAIFCFCFNIKYAYWLDVSEKPSNIYKTVVKKILLKACSFLFVTGVEGINRISKWYNLEKKKFRDFPYLSAPVNEEKTDALNEEREKMLVEDDKVNILICNRFEERKGYHSLYEALKIVNKNTLNEFRFLIIGSGTQYEKYYQLFNDLQLDIKIKPWVEYEEYLEFVMSTDVLIHASLHEPFGIPPIDAMAHGKLVITSDAVMSTYDRITNGNNGYLYKAGDSEELAKILIFITQNKNYIYELGYKGRVTSKYYSYKNNIDVINDVMRLSHVT
jgi:glycosyltransferase involved in cell wall biosynthesis